MPTQPSVQHEQHIAPCIAALADVCERASFDVFRHADASPPLRLSAVFHQRSEGYALIRKATLWAAETHEYIYVYTPPFLDAPAWDAIRENALSRGLDAVRPHAEHMASYISVVLLCGGWRPDAADAVRRTRFTKSFLWGLRGWVRLRTLAVRLAAPGEGAAGADWVCNASARNALLPLMRRALSPLLTLQELAS